MSRLPLYLLLLIMPLAVAGQNIGTGVVAVILFYQIYRRRRALDWPRFWGQFRVPLGLSLAFVSTLMLATCLNEANPDRGAGALAFGHAIWVFLPPFVYLAQPRLDAEDWRKLFRCFAFVVLVMGVAALSQAIWGWKLSGSDVVFGFNRARGFYSHPLTFAYVGLILFPLGCAVLAKMPQLGASWASFLGAGAIVYASQSRTVQAVCILVAAGNILYFAKGKVRIIFCVVGLAAGLALAVTDNPMKQRFEQTLSAEGHDVRSHYADDRLAFWDANWGMVRERPILGHGDHLNTAYRAPYYERIGLAGFERMYEAHNMYLQVLVNAGIVGLVLFLGWYFWYLRLAARLGRQGFGGKVALQTLLALAAAALTQNAFQDSEVRFALSLLCCAMWLASHALSAEASRPR